MISKKYNLLILIYLVICFANQAKSQSIIPAPAEIKTVEKGRLIINSSVKISYDKKLIKSAQFLHDYLAHIYDLKLVKTSNPSAKKTIGIHLKINSKYKPEAYSLTINKQGVMIEGSETGVFYGVQSLLQLFPNEKQSETILLPFININDYPRFSYRGMMLDVSRHYFDIDFIKKMLDYMAYHKLNRFQWHLCDDQGWRLEIKSYPRLTQVGAWRNGTIIGLYPGTGNDHLHYGGYYTQEQIKEIVKYASDRYISVIPEIEMPGHCLAALTSYPFLGCTKSNYEVSQIWGYSKDVLCVGNDSVFTFLKKVLDEVVELFPSKYIHIGGDECPTDRWKQCPKCQARMKANHLTTERGLQTYMTREIENYLLKKGRKIIAWDETLDDDSTTNACIMSWRGDGKSGAIKGTRTNHKVIMAPSYGFYLDYPQKTKEDSLAANWGGVTSVNKTYHIEPVFDQIDAGKADFVIGTQANIWTEYMSNSKKVEYMAFPRLSAVCEVAWSPKSKRNWDDFKQRMQNQYYKYKLWGLNFNPSNIELE